MKAEDLQDAIAVSVADTSVLLAMRQNRIWISVPLPSHEAKIIGQRLIDAAKAAEAEMVKRAVSS